MESSMVEFLAHDVIAWAYTRNRDTLLFGEVEDKVYEVCDDNDLGYDDTCKVLGMVLNALIKKPKRVGCRSGFPQSRHRAS